VRLLIREARVQIKPDCVIMFDNGLQATCVSSDYVKRAKLKKVAESKVCVKGMGSGDVFPTGVFEVPLEKLEGGTVRVRA
jgi:uncharacterized protein (AIM24 family)